MDRQSIYEYPVTRTVLGAAQLSALMRFLLSERTSIVVPPETKTQIMSLRPVSQTVMSNIFSAAMSANAGRAIALLNIPKSISSIPEVVTYQGITFDTSQFKSVIPNARDILRGTEFDQKIVSNITPLVDKNQSVSDLSVFHKQIVRDLLVRSHYTTEGSWLPIPIARQTAKIYTMSLGALVARAANLDYQTGLLVQAVFLYFYLYNLSKSKTLTVESFKGALTELRLGDMATANAVSDYYAEHTSSGGVIELDQVCEVLRNLGIGRLTQVATTRFLRTQVQAWSNLPHESRLAIEYPPYWVHLLLRVISGEKIRFSGHLTKSLNISMSNLRELGGNILRAVETNTILIPS